MLATVLFFIDEFFVRINGKQRHHWRATDQGGEVVDVFLYFPGLKYLSYQCHIPDCSLVQLGGSFSHRQVSQLFGLKPYLNILPSL